MKYTRYDIKSKKKKDDWKTTLMLMLGVLILAILIGSLIFFKVLPKKGGFLGDLTGGAKNTEVKDNGPKNDASTPPVVPAEDKKEEEKPADTKVTSEASTYTMLQCGYFSTKESADAMKAKIGTEGKVLSDGDKFRVVTFIGNEEEAVKRSDELLKAGIESTKTRFNVPNAEESDKAIIEMINGSFNILNKLSEKDVQSVNTEDFKKWTNELKGKEADKNYKVFNTFKEKINALPNQLEGKDTEIIYQMNYDIINQYK